MAWGFGWAVSSGNMAHGFAGLGEEVVVFGAAFFGSGFGSVGAFGEFVHGDEVEHFQEEAALFAGGFACGVEDGGPVAEGVEGAFEADAGEWLVVLQGGGLHDVADDIVGDEVHVEFACDHVGGAAAEDFHAEEGFEFAEVQLDGPALVVEFAEGFEGVELGVEEGGGDEAACGAETFGGELDFHDSDGEGVGEGGELFFAEACGWGGGFGPGLELVVGAEFFAFGDVELAPLVESYDAVDAAILEFRDGVIGAKASIGEEDVVFFQEVPQAAEEEAFVDVGAVFGPLEEGAAGEGEEADEAQEGEAAAGFLGGGLGVLLLVEGSVWHGDGCAVDDFDVAAFPEGVAGGVAFASLGDVVGDGGEGFFGKFGAGIAVGDGLWGGVGVGFGGGVPGLDAADDFAAGGSGGEDLGEEGPEDNRQAVNALAAVGALGGGGEKFVGNGIGADGFEVAQGVGEFEFFEGFGLFGFGAATEEQGPEGGEKGSGVFHVKRKRIHTHA